MLVQILNLVIAFRWFFVLVAVILIWEWLVSYIRQRNYRKWLEKQKTLNDLIHNLRPDEFEDYVGNLFRKLGYKVTVIGGIHQSDGGFDIKAEKDGQKYYIQVKKYNLHHPVRVQQIREFYGALKADHPDSKGIFVTTSFFTSGFIHSAESFAKKVGIELIDGKRLVEKINLANSSLPEMSDKGQ